VETAEEQFLKSLVQFSSRQHSALVQRASEIESLIARFADVIPNAGRTNSKREKYAVIQDISPVAKI